VSTPYPITAIGSRDRRAALVDAARPRRGPLGGAWWGWALVAWAVVAVIGYRGVTLGASVVAVVLVLELGMIVLFDVTALTHPAQTDVGAWLQPWRLGLLTLMTGTCLAVIAYYRPRAATAPDGSPEPGSGLQERPAWWIRCGAPALGGLALAAALTVTVANLGPSLADPSGIAPVLLPLLVVAAALAGAQRARWLRGNDPAAWQRLGRGRPAPLALRDVVVADLEL